MRVSSTSSHASSSSRPRDRRASRPWPIEVLDRARRARRRWRRPRADSGRSTVGVGGARSRRSLLDLGRRSGRRPRLGRRDGVGGVGRRAAVEVLGGQSGPSRGRLALDGAAAAAHEADAVGESPRRGWRRR